MENKLNTEVDVLLSICKDEDHEKISKIGYALSSLSRIKILQNILMHPKTLTDIAIELSLPISSVSKHVDILADANLLNIYYNSNLKGHKKYSTQVAKSYTVSLESKVLEVTEKPEYSVEMPIGLFSDCDIQAPCGLAGKKEPIGAFDSPNIFFTPQRIGAELLWFNCGFITYNFPTDPLRHHECSEISFSFEVCSETQYYNNNWPSDITVKINDIEIATFTSPADFGGRRGKYSPHYWSESSTQFGLLKKITVTSQGVFVDNKLERKDITFETLNLYSKNKVNFTIGVKEDAVHKGGINLFGKNFGDHNQSIIMTVK